jgi:ABC-type phosphate/phosphonate transport system permease subunit
MKSAHTQKFKLGQSVIREIIIGAATAVALATAAYFVISTPERFNPEAEITGIFDESVGFDGSRVVHFEWMWTDWLGLMMFLLSIAFMAAVIAAIIRGVPPLKILSEVGGLLSLGLKRK